MSLQFYHSPADIARWVLVKTGLGSDPTLNPLQIWPIFATSEPPLPDNCITVYDTMPVDQGREMVTGELYQFYGLQIRVRATDHNTAVGKAYNLRTQLSECLSSTGLYGITIMLKDPVEALMRTYQLHSFDKITLTYSGKETPNSKRTISLLNCISSIRRTA